MYQGAVSSWAPGPRFRRRPAAASTARTTADALLRHAGSVTKDNYIKIRLENRLVQNVGIHFFCGYRQRRVKR